MAGATTQTAATKKQFAVFYSWQSDHAKTRSFLRKALNNAIAEVMQKRPEWNVFLDEATRGLPGSPNIPITIMDKIRAADMVVSDVTTINPTARLARRCPNPNVAFELGFAVANLGWARVVIAFDAGVGKFKDLPFDFDRHRAVTFDSVDAAKAAQLERQLTGTLKNAIFSVIDKDPARPTAEMDPDQRKRDHDAKQIKWLLEQVNTGAIDEYLERLPKQLTDVGHHMWIGFKAVLDSSSFHLYDADADKAVGELADAYGRTLAHDEIYDSAPDGRVHVLTRGFESPASVKKAVDEVKTAQRDMRLAFRSLLDLVRTKFPQIDIDATDKIAWEDYRAHRERIESALRD